MSLRHIELIVAVRKYQLDDPWLPYLCRNLATIGKALCLGEEAEDLINVIETIPVALVNRIDLRRVRGLNSLTQESGWSGKEVTQFRLDILDALEKDFKNEL